MAVRHRSRVYVERGTTINGAVDVADLVALSFIHSKHDVDALLDLLARADRLDLGLILKIETQSAFARLPGILLHGMRMRRSAS